MLIPFANASAQDESPQGPVYIIQSGDTLYAIALKFGVTVDDLVRANPYIDPNILGTGAELVIPGLEGIDGKLVTEAIPLGQDLYSLSRFYGVPKDLLNRLNRLTSPAEVYAGSNLIVPQSDQSVYFKGAPPLHVGSSVFEWSVTQNTNPWAVSSDNQVSLPGHIIPKEYMFLRTSELVEPPNPLSPLVSSLSLSPLPLVQGNTTVIKISTIVPVEITGTLNDRPLKFLPVGELEYIAIQGVHALAEPGLANFSIQINTSTDTSQSFSQMVLLQQGFFAEDPPLIVDPSTIDKAITAPEEELIKNSITPVTPIKLWDGSFVLPVDQPWCIKSWYGNRRSYNGSDYVYFHTGVDYGPCASLNIYAPASGTVIFSGPLEVRGNATIIDHGWGIYSGFWHQSELFVTVGETVPAGQLIGYIGGTGRVTGPHLHWEIWANGVQVDPLPWLDQVFP